MGLPYPVFEKKFGKRPVRPGKGGIIDGEWDFTRLDKLTPHPVYGWMGWVSVLNPSSRTFDECQSLLSEAFGKAQRGFEKRLKQQGR